MHIRFTDPQYLWLLPVVWAYSWWVMRGSLADLGTARTRLALGVRALVLTFLLLAMAGIQFIRPTHTLCTVFVVDVSESISPDARQTVLGYIATATKQMRIGDQAALVAFGADALLDHAPDDVRKITQIVAVPDPSRTNIAAGIQMAMATFPQESGKQIILFTDGNENVGNAVEQAGLASAGDVHISVVPLARDTTRGEVLLVRAETPTEARVGAPFQVNVIAEATQETDGTVLLYRNKTLVATQRIHLLPGKTAIGIKQTVPQGGLYAYKAILDVPAKHDTIPDNNVVYAYTRVRGKPRVLIVEGFPGDGERLARTLVANDLQIERGGPDRIPASLAECSLYDSVLFANVPAWTMSPTQMAILRSAVRDTGMGFAMMGGQNSFGAGGYFHTPIEDLLPVSMDVKKQMILPSLTLVIVIDISGSMSAAEDGVQKVRLAGEAAKAAVELLQPVDRVCVIGFDTRAVYVVDMTVAANKPRIFSQIERLEAGGGGILAHDALAEAYKTIHGSNTAIKHVILCADAADTEQHEGCLDVIAQMKREKITLSCIGFGTKTDPDGAFQAEMAKAGGGTAYLAQRLSNLPQIFSRDVMAVGKSLLIEEPFHVRINNTMHPVARGIPWVSSPPLLGYVATSPKSTPSVRVLLTSHKDDPILAAWPYGLGRAVAFTSDATAHWSAHWVNWSGYAAFWSQAVRWTLRQAGTADFQTTLKESGGRVGVQVEAIDAQGEFRNGLDLTAHVANVRPRGEDAAYFSEETMPLAQNEPGRYEGEFIARDTGTYVVTVVERKDGAVQGMQMSTLVIPYSPEYQVVRTNTPLLRQLTDAAHGLLDPPAREIFGKMRFGARTLQDLWPILLLIGALLLWTDIAVRRILIPWDELLALAHAAVATRVNAFLHTRRHAAAQTRQRSVRVGQLLTVKEKSRAPRDTQPAANENIRNLRTSPPATPDATVMPPPASAPPTLGTTASDTSSAVGAMLKRKRERKE